MTVPGRGVTRPATAPEPGSHPLRVVMRLTGLSADTLRIWERRHHAVTPARTDGNARRYSDRDIRRLGLLAAATANGHPIGTLVLRSDEELVRLAAPAPTPSNRDDLSPTEYLVSQFLDAVEAFDPRASEEVLRRGAALLPPKQLALEVIAPAMRAVGDRWHDGKLSVAQEHMATQQARAVVERVKSAGGASHNAERILFAAPEGHLHELGLLIGALLATHHGFDAVVLGANTPIEDMLSASKRAGAPLVVVAVSRDLDTDEQRILTARLRKLATQRDVWIGLPRGHALSGMASVARVFDSLQDLDMALAARASTKS